MNPVAKALWFVESHFMQELTLDHVANAGCVSRYHMSRVFGIATGCSIIRYVLKSLPASVEESTGTGHRTGKKVFFKEILSLSISPLLVRRVGRRRQKT